MNKKLLEDILIIKSNSYVEMAESLGITKDELNRKLNGEDEFKIGEVNAIKEHYGLDGVQTKKIFLC